ncbi:MAG: single-stranded-DNA-specific exonuclease RecJ, partial [Thermodesulfobacteriota bacterium]|nr:single-stranded-DNA-specific exonuclease RecJ [Thermodesulfobacteriota bacterium]
PAQGTNDAAHKLHVSPLIVRLLHQRGLSTLADMDQFLSPGLRHLAPLKSWPGLIQAAEVLANGLSQRKKLAVWGDYDVDGVTATALVKDFLNMRGIPAAHHLPNRLEQGYGLNVQGIEQLADEGVDILLTVDCGITDAVEVARARELGMTVVISDHHLPGPNTPEANAIVNPRLGNSPCPDLAGVGVAFLLMAALNRLLPGEPVDVKPFLDLVALGTVADVVRLTGQNRILVKNGLLLIAQAKRPGIAALKQVSAYNPSAALTAGQIGFCLAPRINAAGRMGEADAALSLLLAPDMKTARPLAEKLNSMNMERRKTEESILEEAHAQAKDKLDSPGLVLFAPHWHPGVIGIVASRMVDKHHRPTIVLTQEHGHIRGSGRSIPDLDLFQAILECEDLLLEFGGHPQAAGMSFSPDNLKEFEKRFLGAVTAKIGNTPPRPRLSLDGELGFGAIDLLLLEELDLLQPFGPGNPEPTFASPEVMVVDHRVFGKNHVKLKLRHEDAGVTLGAKAWRQAENMPADLKGRALKIAFSPKIDRYNGLATIDLKIKDWKVV